MRPNKPAEPSPEVAPTQECDHSYEDGVIDGRMVRHCRKRGDSYGPFDIPAVAPRETQRVSNLAPEHLRASACTAPARVEPTCGVCGISESWHSRRGCDQWTPHCPQCNGETQPKQCGYARCPYFTAQPANTDDRQADTISEGVSVEDAVKGLESIFADLQEDFHDKWDWMNAHFYVKVLEAHYEDFKPAETRIEVLEAALHRIYSWCEAYPLEVFPAPDLQRGRELLGDAEFTRLNAHSMRHVVEGIKKIAALAAPSGEQEKV